MRHRPRGIQLSHPPALSAHCSAVMTLPALAAAGVLCRAGCVRGAWIDGRWVLRVGVGGVWYQRKVRRCKAAAQRSHSRCVALARIIPRVAAPRMRVCFLQLSTIATIATWPVFSPVVVCACESVRGALGSRQQTSAEEGSACTSGRDSSAESAPKHAAY